MDDNIHNLRDALEWLDRRIREEVELDGEMTNEHAIELAFIQRTLERFPPRNCDVGTPEEQEARWNDYCDDVTRGDCPPSAGCRSCALYWAQLPYEAEEGESDAT